MQKKFILYDEDETLVKNLAAQLNITELTAKILCHRGITTVEDAKIFLNPETEQKFNNPFLMKGMDSAVNRIIQAINNKEKIVIYGDYDVDGMTASSIMLRALKKFNVQVESYIPDRQTEGYGFNILALNKIADTGVTLLISVDCGIANVNEIEEIQDRLDVIVTDHHLPFGEIDNAVAVLDPHQPDCEYPDKNLCGAGVAFKLCQALQMKINNIDFNDYTEDIDIAALGTVADIVPLIGENRKIVRLGLAQMMKTENIGLRALIDIAQLTNKKITAGHLGFRLAPRLNAVGRLTTASKGVKLLTTNNVNEADSLAKELDTENTIRKNKEREMLKEANQKYLELRKKYGGDMSSIIVADENWHAGIIGLAASKLVEQHYLPSIVISIQGAFARGSCRSISALHMKDTLDHFKDFFTQYGGHSAAAGFSIRTKDIETFSREFDSYVKDTLNETDFIPQQKVDVMIHPLKMTVKLADEIERLEPFGIGNPHPIFACQNVRCKYPKLIGKDKLHLSFQIQSDDKNKNAQIRALAWNMGLLESIIENDMIDVTFSPERNEFNNSVQVQCIINSIDVSQNTGLFPDREVMVNIYKFLRQNLDKTNFKPFDVFKLNKDFNRSTLANSNPDFNSIYTMLCAVSVFEELGLINFDVDGKNVCMPEITKKLDLSQSRLWRLNNTQQ
ncbi:MAG: single-stranded-DNA-specific exonuclease RecJ [Selenomonadaceae bacterium]|nr:single-stranded-DNA-specific exonuclease RecJ [Selenomonadaceae bacterium]